MADNGVDDGAVPPGHFLMDWDPTAPVAAKEWPGLDSWEVDEPDMAIAMMGCDSTPVASCVADAVVGVGQRRPPVNVRPWSDERSSDVQGCSTMDDYIILNSIDEGTHGRVYRARCKADGKVVAIKYLRTNDEDDGFPITAVREIALMLDFSHPNVVETYGVAASVHNDHGFFLVMECVEHDLSEIYADHADPFPAGAIKTLVRQLFEGVAFLHSHWIIHRDLKTSNLLYSNTQRCLKITDFGLARKFEAPERPMTPDVVTIWYRAPELLLGATEYTTAVDIWAAGCLFAEILRKGDPLFHGSSQLEQLDRIFRILGTVSEDIWPGVSDLPLSKSVEFTARPYNVLKYSLARSKVSEAGCDLLNQCLRYDPKQRSSAEQALSSKWFTEKPPPFTPEEMPAFASGHVTTTAEVVTT